MRLSDYRIRSVRAGVVAGVCLGVVASASIVALDGSLVRRLSATGAQETGRMPAALLDKAPTDFAPSAAIVRGTLGAKLGSGEPEYPLMTYATFHQPGNYEAMRARISGTQGVLASGHHLATQAGYEAFRGGGNAFDAGITAAMVAKALKMDYAGWTGVGPLTYYSAKDNQIGTRVGTGPTPKLFTLAAFNDDKQDASIIRALIPTDIDVWTAALAKYGT